LNEPAHEPVPAVGAVKDLAALRVIADSQRHRILAALMHEPLSAAALSDRLAIPRTRVYYHLELLERHGFVRVSGYRDERTPERLYRATAGFFRIDRALFGSDLAALNHARAALLEAAADDLRHVSPDDETVVVRRAFVRLDPARRKAFADALAALIGEFARDDEHGAECEVVAALFDVPPQASTAGEE
jgi:DNA-binding transcriptional ArsR family regulator